MSDFLERIQPSEVFLATRDLTLIAALRVEDLTYHPNMSSANELSFTVHKVVDGVELACWDKIADLQLVYVRDHDEYFEIEVQTDESTDISKKITGTSLCEAELGQIALYDVEINSEIDIERSDYTKATVFYDPDDPENSLLNRMLEKAPHYSIGTVDNSLRPLVRTFSETETTIYDFFANTVSTELNCLFTFDSATRTINVYDLENMCVDCGERIGIAEVCPHCGSTNIKYGYGEDTTIVIGAENLAESLSRNGDIASIKNCFRLEGGDDLMTATLANINQNGTQYIYHFSNEQKALMPNELVTKLEAYDALYESKRAEYTALNVTWYDLIDEKLYWQSGKMPVVPDTDTTAAKELAKLTTQNLSPVAVSSFSTAAKATVDNAVLAYAKVYVKSTYKVEITQSTYTSGTWRGSFKVTNYSDDEDTATSASSLPITVNGDEERFIKQRIEKALAKDDVADDDYDWTLYNYNVLQGFETAYQSAVDTLIQLGVSDPAHEVYQSIYVPYYEKLVAIRAQLKVVEDKIAEIEAQIVAVEKDKRAINEALDIRAYLGDELWKVFTSYRREQTYSNTNYISDGLDNAELIAKAEEFFKAATKEIITASTPQYTLSCSAYNLLVRPEFAPLWEKFKLGNWLRMIVDGDVHKMRLISYQINDESIDGLTIEFSDVTRTSSGLDDLQSVLSKAQSMASSYEYVSRQASSGQQASGFLSNWVQSGLDATNVKIVNNAQDQTVVMDEHGILGREYDDETQAYSPEQIKIINSGVYITNNDWRETVTAIGRFYLRDTETGELEVAYGVNASVVLGKLLLGEQMQITNAGNTVTIDDNGFVVMNGVNRFTVNPAQHQGLLKIEKINTQGEYVSQFFVDSNGVIHFGDGTVIGSGVSIDLPNATVPMVDASGQVTDKTFIEFLDTDVANIINLQADSAIIQALNAKYIDAQVVTADLANIKTILMGNAGVGDLHAVNLTAANTVIDDAVIQNLIAKKINTLDLTAGSINTKNFTIQSDSGNTGLKIANNTIQMYDDLGQVGVQLGYGSTGKPSLILKDENGNLMLDSQGLHEDIVPDDFIKTNMVADSAITSGKIDWSSANATVDAQGNPVWSAASVTMDNERLDVKFTQVTTTVNTTAADLANTKTTVQETVQTLDATSKELAETKTTVQTTVKDLNETKTTVTTVTKEVATTKEAVDVATKELAETKTTVDTAVKDLETTKTTVNTAVTELNTIKPTVESTAAELNTIKPTVEATAADLEEIKPTVEAAVTDLNTIKPTVTATAEELEATKSTVATVSKEVADTKTTVNTAVKDLADTKATVNTTVAELNTTKATVETAVEELDATKTDLANTSKELETTKSTVASTVSELNSTKATVASTVSDLNSTKQTVASTVNELNATKTDLEDTKSDLATTTQELGTTKSDLAATKTDLNNTKSNLATTNANLATTNANLATTNTNLANTQEELEATQEELELAHVLAKMGTCALLFGDTDFQTGYNQVVEYNTSNNGTVTVERINTASVMAGCPTQSSYCIQVRTAGTAAPQKGGIVQGIRVRANAEYIIRYILKVPVGCTVQAVNTGIGTGGTDRWLTPTAGTGAWAEYVRVIKCGLTGTFNTAGHVVIASSSTYTSSSPLLWYIGSIRAVDTAYAVDITTTLTTAQEITSGQLRQYVDERTIIQTEDESGATIDTLITDFITQQQIQLGTITSTITTLTTLKDSSGATTGEITEIGTYVQQSLDSIVYRFTGIDETLSKFESYIQFGDGETAPQIQLGIATGDNSDVHLDLYNDQIAMTNKNNTKLSWWTTDSFYSTNGVFEDSLNVTNSITVGSRFKISGYTWIGGTSSSAGDTLTLVHV